MSIRTKSSSSSSPGSLASFGGVSSETLSSTGKRAVQGPRNGLKDLSHDSTIRDTRPRKMKVKVDVAESYRKCDFLRDIGKPFTNLKQRVYHKRHVQSVTKTTEQRPSFVWKQDKASKMKSLEQPHGYNLITWNKTHEAVQGREIKSTISRKGSSPSRPADSASRTLKQDRQSSIRFFCSQPDLKNRCDLLVREGLKPGIKKSSVLGIGRGDMPSQGVSDNFENSLYLSTKSNK